MTRAKRWIARFGLPCAVAFTMPTQARAQVPPGAIQYVGVDSAGSGCPAGSVQVVFAPDGSTFTVLYNQFNLRVDAATAIGAIDCEVTIILRKPPMLGFGVEAADFRGFIALEPGVVAEQRVSVQAGAVRELRRLTAEFGRQRWSGPINESYVLSTVRPTTGFELFDCFLPREKTKIIIRSSARMARQSGSGSGMLAVDSADGSMAQQYHLRWQNCGDTIGGIIGGLIGGAIGGGSGRPGRPGRR